MAEKRELTDREREILELVATGASNRQIAQQLHISSNTVKVHLRNIFEKLGVSSRTEATLYAVRNGLVEVEGAQLEGSGSVSESPSRAAQIMSQPWIILVLSIVILVLISFLVLRLIQSSREPDSTLVDVAQLERWTELAHMPTARSGFAITSFDGDIYAIGGETSEGVTDIVERYDPTTDSWELISPKPNAVVDAIAVVIGGEIFVPGGSEDNGAVTDVLEVYDPTTATWSSRSPLPDTLTRYAAVAFEGRLILFGGWNGEEYVDKVYEYDPLDDTWETIATLKEPRGDARAVISGNQIYLLGGHDDDHVIRNLDLYVASAEVNGSGRWTSLEPLPIEKTRFQVTEIADVIYVVGGEEEEGFIQQYLTRSNEWRVSDEIGVVPTSRQGVWALEDYIYLIGGEREGEFLSSNYRYRAIYTIFLPVTTNQ